MLKVNGKLALLSNKLFEHKDDFIDNGFVVLKDDSFILPEYFKGVLKDVRLKKDYALAINLDKILNGDTLTLELFLKNWKEFIGIIRFNKVAFTISDDKLEDVDNDKILEIIKKIIKLIKVENKLEVLTLGMTRQTFSNEDTSHFYGDKVKDLMKELSNLNIAKKLFLIDLEWVHNIQYAVDEEGIKRNHILVDGEKINKVKTRIKEIAQLIKSKTDSPYEQHLLALHYISQYKYNIDDSKPYLQGRSLEEIIPSDAEYICCVGYARLYVEVMRELGFDASTQSVIQHARAKILMKDDPKYNIKSGVYVVDPTWVTHNQSELKGQDKFNFSHYAHLNLNTIKRNIEEIDECQELNVDAIRNRNKREFEYYEDFIKNFDKFSSKTLKYLRNWANVKCLETGSKFYSDLLELVEEEIKMNLNNDNFLVENSDIKKIITRKSPKVLDEQLLSFYSLTPEMREEKMTEFFNFIYDDYIKVMSKKNSFSDSNANSYLYDEARKFGIPSGIASACFMSETSKVLNLDHQAMFTLKFRLKKANASTPEGYFKLISKFAKDMAREGVSRPKIFYPEEMFSEKEAFRASTLPSYEGNSEALSVNFTSLSDEEFKKILNGTKDIDEETLKRGSEAIKKLVRVEDYRLFPQIIGRGGVNVDPSFG